MLYCIAINTGVGFITHEDRENFDIAGYPGNVWVTFDNVAALAWMTRTGTLPIFKAEAQAALDAACYPDAPVPLP